MNSRHTTTPTVVVKQKQTKMRHIPSLDGLRGLAVIGVLCFHGGFSWAKGGYLGVSLFFTLSGFLITSLIIYEFQHSKTGNIALRKFWTRRFRRLLPASIVTVFLAILYIWLFGDPVQSQRIAGDVIGAFGYVANWRFYQSGQSYAEALNAPSPLLHFWSLAIEEQFYVVFPLLVSILLGFGTYQSKKKTHRDRFSNQLRIFTVTIIGLSILVTGLFLVLTPNFSRFYYGTDFRSIEILAGVLLAIFWFKRNNPFDQTLSASGPTSDAKRIFTSKIKLRLLNVFTTLALLSTLLLWVFFDNKNPFLRQGGTFVVSALSVWLLIGCCVDATFISKLTRLKFLRKAGELSYGLYLYHWPIFLWLTPSRTGLSGIVLFILRMTITAIVAEISARYIELPIRYSRGWAKKQIWSFGVVAIVLLALIARSISQSAPESILSQAQKDEKATETKTISMDAYNIPEIDLTRPVQPDPNEKPTKINSFETTLNDADDFTGLHKITSQLINHVTTNWQQAFYTEKMRENFEKNPYLTPKNLEFPNRRLRVLVVGDSTALFLGTGLDTWGKSLGTWDIASYAHTGCPVLDSVRYMHVGQEKHPLPACTYQHQTWLDEVTSLQPDIVIMASGSLDTSIHKFSEDAEWKAPGDPTFDEHLLYSYKRAMMILGSSGAAVMWLTSPPALPSPDAIPPQPEPFDEQRPERFTRVNEIVMQASEGLDFVSVVPYANFFEAWPQGVHDKFLRPDGLHVEGEGLSVVSTWLGAEILNLFWDNELERAGKSIQPDNIEKELEPFRPESLTVPPTLTTIEGGILSTEDSLPPG